MSGKMPSELKVLRHRELPMLKRERRSRESIGTGVCRVLIIVLWSPILTKIGTIISLLMSLKVWFGPPTLSKQMGESIRFFVLMVAAHSGEERKSAGCERL